ncbi:Hypothetical_protein [Hexamita inflata]|uniref:Hypothetical_protein n=1 Tax=Hexamita inflata TaxID=28002 RepID=A0AA86QD94_9EUKA|nr:Hypothetical protein HINF_LOCUS44794 [Hexamita inflata]
MKSKFQNSKFYLHLQQKLKSAMMKHLIQQLQLSVNEDGSEDVLTVLTGNKIEIFFIFLNSKPAGGTVELSEGKSYYVGIYSYDNFDPDLQKECIYETVLFCSKGQPYFEVNFYRIFEINFVVALILLLYISYSSKNTTCLLKLYIYIHQILLLKLSFYNSSSSLK